MSKLVALALVVSANAWACPDLTGTYTCQYQDGQTEVITLSQENKDGVVTYTYNNNASIPADNVAYPVPDGPTLREGTLRAWCEADTFKSQLVGKYYDQGVYFGDLTLNIDFAKVGNDLKQVNTGSVKNSASQYPINGEVVCTAGVPRN
jgi:hypothetical protein